MISLPVLNGCNTLPLSRGLSTLVSAEDYEAVGRVKWSAKVQDGREGAGFYAYRGFPNGHEFLHTRLLNPPPGMKTDHRDGDGLNNTRENLRPASNFQNARNKRAKLGKKFKGTRFRPGIKGVSWAAQIAIGGKVTHLGTFATEEAAARAYDAAALEHFGEFSRLNFPAEAVAPSA